MTPILFTFTAAQLLNVGINVLLPLLVALVTNQLASSGLKATLLLFLSAVSGFLVSWLDAVNGGVPFDWSQAVLTVLSGFIVAVASHFGLLSPLNITGSNGLIQAAVPQGVGGRGRHEA